MDNLQKQFNKVNSKIQVLKHEVDKLKNTQRRIKKSRFNQFIVVVFTNTIFFILGMIAYKFLALSGGVK